MSVSLLCEIEKGEELFARMTPAQQDAKLGQAAGAAYRAGAVKLIDFVGVRRDPDWGDTRYVKSLRQVVGDSEAKRWMRVAQQRQQVEDVRRRVTVELAKLDVDATVRSLFGQRKLPQLAYHFERHGAALGCQTITEYEARFLAAMNRRYEEIFVTRQSKARSVLMWLAFDQATNEVLQFNQTSGQVHSFYWVEDWSKYLASVHPVRIVLVDGIWRVQQ